MTEESGEPQRIEIQEEFRACTACDYTNGFHVSFVGRKTDGGRGVTIVLICPSCGARYDVDWSL